MPIQNRWERHLPVVRSVVDDDLSAFGDPLAREQHHDPFALLAVSCSKARSLYEYVIEYVLSIFVSIYALLRRGHRYSS